MIIIDNKMKLYRFAITILIRFCLMCFIFRIADREKVNIPNIRNPPTSNVTKFSLNNEFSHNNTYIQTKSSSTIVFPNSGDGKNPRINKLTPEPNVIEKCSMNGSFCIKVDNYPRLFNVKN